VGTALIGFGGCEWIGKRIAGQALIVENLEMCAGLVDFEKTGAMLPAAQDDESRGRNGFVDSSMNVADYHQIRLISKASRIVSINGQMPLFVRQKSLQVLAFQHLIKALGDRARQEPEGLEELSTLHECLPLSAGAQQVAVNQVHPHSVHGESKGFRNDRGPQRSFIKGAHPEVMVARHDRQFTAPGSKINQSLYALRAQDVVLAMSGAHPEVAKVAHDHQGGVDLKALNPGGESTSPVGVVVTKVDIAGKVMGQLRPILSTL
jgi:hypothetical protein